MREQGEATPDRGGLPRVPGPAVTVPRVSDAWPLVGTRVVDLSSGLAGAYCTKLLADGGADVVKVEDPVGDPLRRESESGAAIPPGEDGALFRFLSTSKDSVVASAATDVDVDLVHVLLDEAEIVVWSAGTSVADDPRFAPERLWRERPGLVVTALSPFGLDGPWRDRRPPTSPGRRSAAVMCSAALPTARRRLAMPGSGTVDSADNLPRLRLPPTVAILRAVLGGGRPRSIIGRSLRSL